MIPKLWSYFSFSSSYSSNLYLFVFVVKFITVNGLTKFTFEISPIKRSSVV